ncbi:MAG: GDSL-type esterase/lipase family protein [Flavobacterium sp.]
MFSKIYLFLVIFLFGFSLHAQETDSLLVETDSVDVVIPENGILNPNAMSTFLNKLADLEKTNSGKINIVHIGDSHIQADLLTDRIRTNLQNTFGNGGRGFVFPHKLARTNGSWDVRFISDVNWDNHKIVSTDYSSFLGLSGIALTTTAENFNIELSVKDSFDFFNTIKIITPENENSFAVATSKIATSVVVKISKKKTHKIKGGEVLSVIAAKYDVSVANLKKANGLKSENIRAGKILKIPSDEKQSVSKKTFSFQPLPMISDENYHYYSSDKSLNQIYLVPTQKTGKYALNGLVLENNNSGIVYHNIGINGCQLSHYNKYPLFFEQLKALKPDLVVVSLGTNESFSRLSSAEYMKQLNVFLQNIKTQNPNVEFLISTPPPSLFSRKIPNVFVADYANSIIENASKMNYSVWDLYSQMGGFANIKRNFNAGIIGSDRVHYTKSGYEKQGDLLSKAIIKTLDNYKTIVK